MQGLEKSTQSLVLASVAKILAMLEQVEVNSKPEAVAALLVPEPGTFLRASMSVAEGKLVVIIEREVDQFSDADHELGLSLPQREVSH